MNFRLAGSADAAPSVLSPAPTGNRLGRLAAALVILAAAGHGLAPWVQSRLSAPHDPLSLRVLMRPGGDPDYYTILRAMSEGKLGDTQYLESERQGLRPFPVFSLMPHAACLAAFGLPGYIIADVLVSVAFLAALWLLLRQFGFSTRLSLCVSLLVVSGLPDELVRFAQNGGFLPEMLRLNLWNARIPRNFVTNVYLLLMWGWLLRFATDHRFPLRWGSWIGLGAGLGVLLQGDVYSAISCTILAAMAAASVLCRNRRLWRRLAGHAGAGMAAFTAVSCPFFCQLLFTDPDVARRYGVFPVPRLRPLVSLACHRRLFEVGLLVAAAFLALVWLSRRRGGDSRTLRARLLCLGLVPVIAFIALPASCVVLGKSVQVYNFDDRIEVACSYCVLIVSLLLVESMSRRTEVLASRWWTAAVAAVFLASAGAVAFQATRAPEQAFRWLALDTERPPNITPARYWSDFRNLLDRFRADPRLSRAEVLGSVDLQWAIWWTAFGPGRMFVGSSFSAVVSDQVQERRLLCFCRLLGVREAQLPRLLQNPHFNAFWLACGKYQASRAYTFRPLDDYDPEELPGIRKQSVDDAWHLVVPQSEMRRLVQAYAETSLEHCEFRLPDVIVLTTSQLSSGLRPRADQYVEVYGNDTFRAWARR